MFQQLFWHSWFRVHLKHRSSNHNTSRDLEVQKTCIKIGNHRCYKCKEKAIWGGQIIVLWIPLTQVQMLKSFNSLLIKFNVSTQNILPEFFFQPTIRCMIFLFGQYSYAGIFFLRICTCRTFFFKITQLPLQKLNGWPLKHPDCKFRCQYLTRSPVGYVLIKYVGFLTIKLLKWENTFWSQIT